MKRISKLCFVLMLMVTNTSGCWNLREPDQLAFALAGGLDQTKDGKFQLSALIAVPSGLGGSEGAGGGLKKKSFRIISATGKDVYDTVPNLQVKLSRRIFIGHRQVILIGQSLAEHGISNVLDEFIRNPHTELRSRIFAVKGGQAKDILSVEPMLETFPSTEILRQQESLGFRSYYFYDFLAEALSQGLQPIVPAVSLSPENQIIYSGSAIFNKDDGLKLVGFLNPKESSYVNWIKSRLNNFVIASNVSKGKGTVSLSMESLSKQVDVKMVGGQARIFLRLSGEGSIVENNTNLDPTKLKDLRLIQNKLSQTTQKSVQQLVEKVQKEYKTDIFGFGERVHQQYPYQWKTMKQQWNQTFPDIHVSVSVDIQCKYPGNTHSKITKML
jgi:spore germination protein KC